MTPTLDELITQFNGATIFSKIDLRSGYHQLVLHPSSRYITTFSTHVGLYQYKRLSFGIHAAAEVFQHEIQTVIQGVARAINISDDIAIFGVDQRAHDKALNEVLQKLQNAGLTANLEKCEFGKNKMEFFGLVFSDKGVSPDPKKVADLHDAKEPQTSPRFDPSSAWPSSVRGSSRTLQPSPSHCVTSRSRLLNGDGVKRRRPHSRE